MGITYYRGSATREYSPCIFGWRQHRALDMNMSIYKAWNKKKTTCITDFYTILIILTNASDSIITYSHICLIHLPRENINKLSSPYEKICRSQSSRYLN